LKLKDVPRELVKDLVRPLISIVVSDNEPVSDLNIELCSAKLEAMATELLSVL